jgi:hypothetical protein
VSWRASRRSKTRESKSSLREDSTFQVSFERLGPICIPRPICSHSENDITTIDDMQR